MRNCLCIILFLVFSLTIPATSVYAYGGGGEGGESGGIGGGMIETESTSSDTTNPPTGFKPGTQESDGSEITTSSETDPGKEEEVAELVDEVNLMEETAEEGDDKTKRSSSAPYWTIGGQINAWVTSHPVEAWRDSVVNRVPRGECCVDASKDRASDIATHLQSLVDSGELDLGDHTLTIGSRSGYQVPLSGYLTGLDENIGTHTYTVVQIHDANGKFQGAWEVDTYVTNHVLPHSKVDLVREYPGHVKTVVPGKKSKK